MSAHIRPYNSNDLDALYAICLATGNAGADATALYKDPKLMGHIYAGPYGVLAPELCFVVEDENGVAGYIVGALDTMAWIARLEKDWWPDLRARYADTTHILDAERTPDEQRIAAFHHPERPPSEVVAPSPAHIHMNILPRLQGQGMGSQLLQTWLANAKEQGATSVHLGASKSNLGGVAFWRKQGFEEIALPNLETRTIWMRRPV